MDAATDAEVISSSLDEPRRFGVLFDRHAGTLFRFLVRRVGPDTADELLGETFRIAFEGRAGFDLGRESARPWLYGIASNLVAKHRRSEARRLRATARLVPDVPGVTLADRVAATTDARSVWPAVVDAIAALPDHERDTLLLFAWEELRYDEIADALQLPIGTVRSRLHRARSRLRELAPASGEEAVSRPTGDRSRIAP